MAKLKVRFEDQTDLYVIDRTGHLVEWKTVSNGNFEAVSMRDCSVLLLLVSECGYEVELRDESLILRTVLREEVPDAV